MSMNEMIGKRYIKYFVVSLGIILLSLLGLYVKLDPYHHMAWLGFSKKDSSQELNSYFGNWPLNAGNRTDKMMNVQYVKPDTSIFGSSTVYSIVDVYHPGFKRYNNRPGYNFGYAGANINEIYQTVKHTMAIKKQQLIVVGMEFFMFSAEKKAAAEFDSLPKAYNKNYTQLIFKKMATQAFSTLWIEQALTKEINNSFAKLRDLIPYPKYVANAVETSEMTREEYLTFLLGVERMQTTALYPYPWQEYHFQNNDKNVFESLKNIIQLARDNNSDIILYISPNHARAFENIRAMGFWPAYQTWLRKLTEIVADDNLAHANEKQTALWDFSQYNSVTTKPFIEHPKKTGGIKDYYDSFHFRTSIGNLLLDRIFAMQTERLPDDFGVLLTPDSIEPHLRAMDARREQYAKAHQAEIVEQIQMVDSLKHVVPHVVL